jgi:No apical meristem-associated C-terminal domain
MDNCGATFKMLEAWKVLRSSPKFSGGLTRVKCAGSEDGDGRESDACTIKNIDGNPSPTNFAGEQGTDKDTKHEERELECIGRSVGRPRGRKAGKEALNQNEMSKKRMRLLEDDVRAAQSKIIALQEYNMIKIMTKLFDKGNAAAIKWFEDRENIEMARLLKELPNKESSVGNSSSNEDSFCINVTAENETGK